MIVDSETRDSLEMVESMPRPRRHLAGAGVRLGEVGLGLLGVVGVIALWALLSATGFLPETDIPTPSAVASALYAALGTSAFWSEVGQTARSALLGLTIAFAVTLPLSIAMGMLWPVNAAFNPIVQFLRPVPGVALLPVAILLFGATPTMDVALVSWGCSLTLLVQLIAGGPRRSAHIADDRAGVRVGDAGAGPLGHRARGDAFRRHRVADRCGYRADHRH